MLLVIGFYEGFIATTLSGLVLVLASMSAFPGDMVYNMKAAQLDLYSAN
jgi:hypothetical protein